MSSTGQVSSPYSPPEGAWLNHSENLLLSLLGSEDIEDRKFAVEKIKEIRGDYGDKSVRDFHVPQLIFEADSKYNLIDPSESQPF